MSKALRSGLVVILCAMTTLGCAPAKLVGDPLPGALAPDFTLIDGPTGEPVTLSSLGGRVVLLTFPYTSCVDTCPLTAETPATTRQFVIDHRLEGSLRYLIGSPAVLARVWQAYGIAEAVTGRDVLHSDVIYLIDKKERGRVLLHSIVTAETLASDLSLLANER
jgi:protein SCO1/2